MIHSSLPLQLLHAPRAQSNTGYGEQCGYFLSADFAMFGWYRPLKGKNNMAAQHCSACPCLNGSHLTIPSLCNSAIQRSVFWPDSWLIGRKCTFPNPLSSMDHDIHEHFEWFRWAVCFPSNFPKGIYCKSLAPLSLPHLAVEKTAPFPVFFFFNFYFSAPFASRNIWKYLSHLLQFCASSLPKSDCFSYSIFPTYVLYF